MKSWMVIGNPSAGRGLAARRAAQLGAELRARGLSCELGATREGVDARALAREAFRRGHRRFAVVGGDGTINEVVDGLCGPSGMPPEDIVLAPVAGGTANEWLHALGMPLELGAAAALIAAEATTRVDLGVVTCRAGGKPVRRCFVNVAGAGFDAVVAGDSRRSPKGRWRYVAAILRNAGRYRAPLATVSVAGRASSARLLTLLVSLGPRAGGGMKVAPQAKLADGLFDLTLVREMAAWRLLWECRRLVDGTICRSRFVDCLQASALSIEAVPAVPVQTDGEIAGETPAEFAVLPRALRVVAGRAGAAGREKSASE
jgi:diacylglycerol kinase (ATP)